MEFALALGAVVTLASVYLLHQFWSGDLRSEDDRAASPTDHEPPNEALKAA